MENLESDEFLNSEPSEPTIQKERPLHAQENACPSERKHAFWKYSLLHNWSYVTELRIEMNMKQTNKQKKHKIARQIWTIGKEKKEILRSPHIKEQ